MDTPTIDNTTQHGYMLLLSATYISGCILRWPVVQVRHLYLRPPPRAMKVRLAPLVRSEGLAYRLIAVTGEVRSRPPRFTPHG